MPTSSMGQTVPVVGNPDYPDDSDVAERVRLLWRAEGFETSAAYAAHIGVSPNRLYNVERGSPLGKDMAIKMVQGTPGLSLDWLWFGRTDTIPLELRRRLEMAARGRSAATRKR